MKTPLTTLALLFSLVFGLTGCSATDPLEPLNRKIYQGNTDLRPYVLAPLVTTYGYIMPRSLNTMLLNTRGFVKLTFSIPVQAALGNNVLSLTNRWIINLFLGGAGSIDVASHYLGPLPESADHSWPIVLPVLGPIGIVPFIGSVVGSKVLGLFIPQAFLSPWSILGALGNELDHRQALARISQSPDPYQAHIKYLRTSSKSVEGTQSYPIPDTPYC